jgi:hypothetical protein
VNFKGWSGSNPGDGHIPHFSYPSGPRLPDLFRNVTMLAAGKYPVVEARKIIPGGRNPPTMYVLSDGEVSRNFRPPGPSDNRSMDPLNNIVDVWSGNGFPSRFAEHRHILVGKMSPASLGRPTVVITHSEDFPFLDCYTPSHATPGHSCNPTPCSFGKPYPRPSGVPHFALPHRAPGICTINADGGGSGGMADGQACTNDAD